MRQNSARSSPLQKSDLRRDRGVTTGGDHLGSIDLTGTTIIVTGADIVERDFLGHITPSEMAVSAGIATRILQALDTKGA